MCFFFVLSSYFFVFISAFSILSSQLFLGPACFDNARDLALVRKFPEADAAQIKLAHVAAFAAAAPTAKDDACRKFCLRP